MFGSRTTRIRRARLVPIALTTAALSSAVIGASVTGTLSAYSASITNISNTASSGALVMKETSGDGTGTACLSTASSDNDFATCTTYDKYGGTSVGLTPGHSNLTSVRIYNTGTNAVGGFSLAPGACQLTRNGTNNGSLCDSLRLTVTCLPSTAAVGAAPSTLIASTSLNALAAADIKALASTCVPASAPNSGSWVTFNFDVALPANADSSVQNQQVSQTLKWTFTGA